MIHTEKAFAGTTVEDFSASCESVPFVAVVPLPFFLIFFFQNSGR